MPHLSQFDVSKPMSLSMGMVFSATNYTEHAVSLTAPAIEVKTGSKWTEQGGPNLQCIVFTGPGCPIHLSPHQAAYFVIEFSTRVPGSSPGVNYLPQGPTGTPWRLRLNVQDNLTGLADASARVKRASAVAALLRRGSMLTLKRYAQSWNRRSAECWQKHAV